MLTNPTEEAVSILPIVGMGGLGKTTLARNVFNHPKIKAHFGQCIWVHVSQNFDAGGLFKKIHTNLKLENVENGSDEDVLKKLQEALKATTYLLVLDDIWNEDQQKWGDFIRSWSGITSTKGNGIVVTTRNIEGFGTLVKTLDMDHLNVLSDEQCWSIIKDRAIEGGSIIRDDLEEGAPDCSIFPKGDRIKKVRLIELWMAQGFQPDQTSDMETVGNKKFNNLLHNSLLQVVDRDEYCEVESCSMHDLVHDVASSILDSTYFKNIHVSSHVPKEQAKWYVYWGFDGDESSRIPKVEAKWLRTLIYNGGISYIVFSDFKSLHSLTLTNGYMVELPDSIRELIHLRYLDISITRIRYLPNSIGELSQLQGLTSLCKLSIEGCQVALMNFVSEMAPLLEDLHVSPGDSDAWDCVSIFNKVVDGYCNFDPTHF